MEFLGNKLGHSSLRIALRPGECNMTLATSLTFPGLLHACLIYSAMNLGHHQKSLEMCWAWHCSGRLFWPIACSPAISSHECPHLQEILRGVVGVHWARTWGAQFVGAIVCSFRVCDMEYRIRLITQAWGYPWLNLTHILRWLDDPNRFLRYTRWWKKPWRRLALSLENMTSTHIDTVSPSGFMLW